MCDSDACKIDAVLSAEPKWSGTQLSECGTLLSVPVLCVRLELFHVLRASEFPLNADRNELCLEVNYSTPYPMDAYPSYACFLDDAQSSRVCQSLRSASPIPGNPAESGCSQARFGKFEAKTTLTRSNRYH